MEGEIYPSTNRHTTSAVAAGHSSAPTLTQMVEQGIPIAKTLVLSCADPRADPSYFLNLTPGGKFSSSLPKSAAYEG
jgi:carbonic anhydrase